MSPRFGWSLNTRKTTLGCTIGARRQRRAQKAAPLRRRHVYPYIELFSSPLHALAAANKVLAAALRSILHRGMPELRGRGTAVISRVLRMLTAMFLSRGSRVPRAVRSVFHPAATNYLILQSSSEFRLEIRRKSLPPTILR